MQLLRIFSLKSRQFPQEGRIIKIKKIIRSKRKSIAMYINNDAALIVRAPFNTSEELINKVILKYMDRLQKTQKEIQLRNLKFKKKEFINRERFLYLGNYYNLKLVDNREILLNFKDEFLLSKKYLSYAKNIFIIWYKRRAYEIIFQRVKLYAQKKGFKYNKINITNAQKRWGFLLSPRQSKFCLEINYGSFTYHRFCCCS